MISTQHHTLINCGQSLELHINFSYLRSSCSQALEPIIEGVLQTFEMTYLDINTVGEFDTLYWPTSINKLPTFNKYLSDLSSLQVSRSAVSRIFSALWDCQPVDDGSGAISFHLDWDWYWDYTHRTYGQTIFDVSFFLRILTAIQNEAWQAPRYDT